MIAYVSRFIGVHSERNDSCFFGILALASRQLRAMGAILGILQPLGTAARNVLSSSRIGWRICCDSDSTGCISGVWIPWLHPFAVVSLNFDCSLIHFCLISLQPLQQFQNKSMAYRGHVKWPFPAIASPVSSGLLLPVPCPLGLKPLCACLVVLITRYYKNFAAYFRHLQTFCIQNVFAALFCICMWCILTLRRDPEEVCKGPVDSDFEVGCGAVDEQVRSWNPAETWCKKDSNVLSIFSSCILSERFSWILFCSKRTACRACSTLMTFKRCRSTSDA